MSFPPIVTEYDWQMQEKQLNISEYEENKNNNDHALGWLLETQGIQGGREDGEKREFVYTYG